MFPYLKNMLYSNYTEIMYRTADITLVDISY